MELHIKHFSYRNIQKKEQKLNMLYLLFVLICMAVSFSAITYDVFSLSYIMDAIAIILISIIFRKIKKQKKLRKNISYDLIVIDEFHRFFYNNIFIEMEDLENFTVMNDGIDLVFKDYCLSIENTEGMIDYLKKFTKEGYEAKMNLKLWINSLMLAISFLLIIKNVCDILFGVVYCVIEGAVFFDRIGLIINIIQIIILIMVVVICSIVARKFKVSINLPAYTCALILYILLPLIISTGVTFLNDDVAYVTHEESINVYRDVKKFYGKELASIDDIDQSTKVRLYEDIVYIISKNELFTYNLNNEEYDINDIIDKYNNSYLTAEIDNDEYMLEIKDNIFYFTDSNEEELDTVEVNAIGENIIAFQYHMKYYFVHFGKSRSYGAYTEIYLANNQKSGSMIIYDSENVEENESNTEETVETETTDENENQYEKEKEELYRQRYNEYQEVIKQSDVTNYQSTKNVVKVTCDSSDIYEVIKEVDKEITRINNEEGVILDVQIGSMLVYSQYNDEYGIMIHTAVDRNGERGYGYSETILMKKYGNDYIATRVGNDYMPSVGTTNNGSYNTSQTTKYLYRVEGNKVVPNAW